MYLETTETGQETVSVLAMGTTSPALNRSVLDDLIFSSKCVEKFFTSLQSKF